VRVEPTVAVPLIEPAVTVKAVGMTVGAVVALAVAGVGVAESVAVIVTVID
jgi:hypothetical protein